MKWRMFRTWLASKIAPWLVERYEASLDIIGELQDEMPRTKEFVP